MGYSIITFILNIPFTIIGLIPALLSIPMKIKINKEPLSIIFNVRRFWWVFGYIKYARAMTVGHTVILGPRLLKNDLEHELVHVKQIQKYLFLFPFVYYYEFFKNGYRKNKFENEAYELSNSIYEGFKR